LFFENFDFFKVSVIFSVLTAAEKNFKTAQRSEVKQGELAFAVFCKEIFLFDSLTCDF